MYLRYPGEICRFFQDFRGLKNRGCEPYTHSPLVNVNFYHCPCFSVSGNCTHILIVITPVVRL